MVFFAGSKDKCFDDLDFTFLPIPDHICPFPAHFLIFPASFYTFAIMYCVSMLTSLCIMDRGVCACVCACVCMCVPAYACV